jgi:RHS repeat-associated protein
VDTRYVWDDATSDVPELVAELDDSNSSRIRAYAHGPLGPQMLHSASGDWFDYHSGPVVGSIEQATDEVGASVLDQTFTAWGETSTSSGTLTQPLGFAGERGDPVTGNLHLRAREYDPGLGVFTSPDPVERSVSLPFSGTYNYAEGVPTFYTDPMGTCVFAVFGPTCLAWSAAKEFGPDLIKGALLGEEYQCGSTTRSHDAWKQTCNTNDLEFVGACHSTSAQLPGYNFGGNVDVCLVGKDGDFGLSIGGGAGPGVGPGFDTSANALFSNVEDINDLTGLCNGMSAGIGVPPGVAGNTSYCVSQNGDEEVMVGGGLGLGGQWNVGPRGTYVWDF